MADDAMPLTQLQPPQSGASTPSACASPAPPPLVVHKLPHAAVAADDAALPETPPQPVVRAPRSRGAASSDTDLFARLPDELVSAIFNALPKLARFRCLALNRRLSPLAAESLWRSIGCWMPAFPETRLQKILKLFDAPTTVYPYRLFVRKIVIMVYNISDTAQLRDFIAKIRHHLLLHCPNTRRLTLAYRGPADWALSPAVLRAMPYLDQLGVYWVTQLGTLHLRAIAQHCKQLRLVHIQPDRAVRAAGIDADAGDALASVLRANSQGRLHEVNLWHLPLPGDHLHALNLPALRLLTLGNTSIPETLLLSIDRCLPHLQSLTLDHPRDRPRRGPRGIANLIAHAPSLRALVLKHIVLSQQLVDVVCSRRKLTSLVLAPVDFRFPPLAVAPPPPQLQQQPQQQQQQLLEEMFADLDLAADDDPDDMPGAGTDPAMPLTPPPPPPLFTAPAVVDLIDEWLDTPDQAAAAVRTERREYINWVTAMVTRPPLVSLELWGPITGTLLLAAAAKTSKLRDVRIRNAMGVRAADARALALAQPPWRSLHIHHAAHLGDAALLHLAFSGVRYLTVTECRATPEALWFVAARATLRKLVVAGPHVRRRDVRAITESLPEAAKRIEVIDPPRPPVVPAVVPPDLIVTVAAAAAAAAATDNAAENDELVG